MCSTAVLPKKSRRMFGGIGFFVVTLRARNETKLRTMAERRRFKSIREGIEWLAYMKKARREYIDKYHTLDGFDPYAVQVPAQV